MNRKKIAFVSLSVALGLGAGLVISAVAFTLLSHHSSFPETYYLDANIRHYDDGEYNFLHRRLVRPRPEIKSEVITVGRRLSRIEGDKEINRVHPEIGPLGDRGAKAHVRGWDADGNLAFDVDYTLDQHWRRISEAPAHVIHERKGPPVLFFGCSFVFGFGVRFEDTIPSRFQDLVPDAQVFNYGRSGFGPGNILRWVRSQEFPADVPSGGIAIFYYLDHHMARLLGATSIYFAGEGWAETLPFFYLDPNGRLVDGGNLSDGRPWTSRLYRALARLGSWTGRYVHYPFKYKEEDFKLMTAVLGAIRDEVKRKTGAELYVVFAPDQVTAAHMATRLDAIGITTLNYAEYTLTTRIAEPTILPDGHPSPPANAFMARQIASDLGFIR